MPIVKVSRWVSASPREVFALAAAMEDYPRFMRNVKEVRVVDRSENHTLTAWKTEVDGRNFNWLEEDHFYPEAGRIDYRLVSGDLKKFEGSWLMIPQDGGTQITLTVDFELGVPLLSALLNPILTKKTRENCQAMLEGIAECLEGR